MGQRVGKVELSTEARSFANLPKKSIYSLWQVFNNVSDGFGISVEEFTEIVADLKVDLNISEVSMREKSAAFFSLLDTDQNGLIDALEFFSVIAVVSGMTKYSIVEFVLSIYDFDGTNALSLDEVVLAMKSAATGLCKIQEAKQDSTREQVHFPKEELIEQLTSLVFSEDSTGEVSDLMRLDISSIADFYVSHPDSNSWYNFFGQPLQHEIQRVQPTIHEIDYDEENPKREWTMAEKSAVDWDVRCSTEDLAIDSVRNPWLSSVAMLTPIEYANIPAARIAPQCSIYPEWLYGYQSQKCRNTVRYNHVGDVLYTVSKYAVVYSFRDHSQNIFTGHNEEILSLCLHPQKEIVATGEIGDKPQIIVWHSTSKAVLSVLQGFHSSGVVQLAFSPDGHLLLSVGNDRLHSMCISRWKERELIFAAPVHTSGVLSCAFLRRQTVVIGGEGFISFWDRSDIKQGSYSQRQGNLSKYTAAQPITVLSPIEDTANLVSGTSSGELLLWVDVNCIRNVKGHNGCVNALYSSKHGIVSGGKDHRIRIWTENLEPCVTFDVSHFGLTPSVRSVCMSLDGTSILFGTKGSNIHEISAIDGSDLRGGPITTGHALGQLTSMSMHPSKHEFITVGQDRTLRVFDMATKAQLKLATFDSETTAVAYSPLGETVVVGFGAVDSPEDKTGAFIVLNEEDLSSVHEARDSDCPITLVCFSPEGETLAVAASDGAIYLYAVQDEYEFIGKCERHTAAVTQIDFSLDGEWIRSNSSDRVLCFFNSDDASYQSNFASMRDVQWASNSCIYSWHMKTIHNSPYEAETVTAAHSPPPRGPGTDAAAGALTSGSSGSGHGFLACGSNVGHIRLLPFPCIAEDAECHRYPAHSCSVRGLRFCYDGAMLVSVGSEDRCAVQWKCDQHGLGLSSATAADDGTLTVNSAPEADTGAASATTGDIDAANLPEDLALEARDGRALAEEFLPLRAGDPSGLLSATADAALDLASSPENDVWLPSIVSPTVLPSIKSAPPDMSFVLDRVYGYESQVMRNSVRYTGNAENIVYTCGAFGITMSLKNKAQKIFKFHSDRITAFASTVDGTLVATGQLGHSPRVAIWDTHTCESVCVLPELLMSSVCAVAFSKSTEYLAVVSNDAQHTLMVYNWRANLVVCKAYCGASQVVGVCFAESDDVLITYGIHVLKFWSGVRGRFPVCKNAVFSEIGVSQQAFMCCEIFAGHPTIGTADGNLYIFDEHVLKHSIKAHVGPVSAMHYDFLSKMLVTGGGSDGVVRLWNSDHECKRELVLDALTKSINPSVRSVAFNREASKVIVGTRGAEIFEFSLADGSVSSTTASGPLVSESAANGNTAGPALAVHGVRELRGLAAHPTKPEFATSGDDATIRIWDANTFKQIKSIKMDTSSRCVTYSSDGKFLAVGFGSGKLFKGKPAAKEGAFVILKGSDLRIVHEGKDTNSYIRVLKFSPDNKILACGSEDCCIYVYNVKDQYSKRATLRCHQAPVSFVDFSLDGKFIMSADSAKRISFSESISGTRINSAEKMRDEKWATQSSPFCWASKGHWLSQPVAVEPCVVQRSWGGLLSASGNTAGGIHVSHNPCPSRAGFLQLPGHTGPISQIAWVAGDVALLSISGVDHSIMQWRCVFDSARETGTEGHMSAYVDSDDEHEPPPAAVRAKSLRWRRAGHQVAATVLDPSNPSGAAATTEQWFSVISPPSDMPHDAAQLPAVLAELDFVHGVRNGDCRDVLRYNADGSAVYIAATLGVIFSRDEISQRFYSGHTRALLSLDVDPSGKVAASGEEGDFPEIHLWDAITGSFITKFAGQHCSGVSSLCFSQSRKLLVSVGLDAMHSIAVFMSPSRAWADGYFLCSCAASPAKISWCVVAENNEYPIAVGGSNFVRFFRVSRGGLENVRGVFSKNYLIQPLLCAVVGKRHVVNDQRGEQCVAAGTATGHVYVFYKHEVVKKVAAHDAPVSAICRTKLGYLTGAKDGTLKSWTDDFKPIHLYKISNFAHRPYSLSCHSIACNYAVLAGKAGGRNEHSSAALVGMRGGEVYEVSLSSHTSTLLLEAHSQFEFHAICMNPTNDDEYATAGDDGMLKIWSLSRRCSLRQLALEYASRAIAWSPDGSRIVVGIGGVASMASKDGALMVIDASTMEIMKEDRYAKMAILDIKFSPEAGKLLALACADGRVYLHEPTAFAFIRTIELPSRSSAVQRVDFSADGKYLRMNSDIAELFFFSVAKGDMVSLPAEVRDVRWAAPKGCFYSWNTQGISRKNIDDVPICALAEHPSGSFIAVAYEDAQLRLYSLPCQSQQAPYVELRGVATKATRLAFSNDGKFLVMLDAYLRVVVQYAVR